MKKFVLAAICTFALVGFVMAEEFTMQITKISDDGTSVTGTKLAKAVKGKGGKGEEVTAKVSKDAKVFKGKFDADKKGLVEDGDDLKVSGLLAAVKKAENGSVTVGGTALTDKDKLVLTIKNGKPAAMLNDKDVDFADVKVNGKAPLTARVTTSDDGTITHVIIGGGGGGFKGKGKDGK